MENLQNKKRYPAVDFSCIFGVILMIGLHFFQKSGFEQLPLTGIISILPLMLRWFCMAGVPLIILVNGAAFSRDTFSFSQYKGLYKLLYCTAACFAIVWLYTDGHPDSFPTSSVKPFYYYDGCDFALLYAVLLLLTPFLNCTYQALPSMKSKTILVAVLAFLSSMPNILIFGGNYILPVELTQLWPVTLYFMGAWIWENRRRFDFLGGFVFTLSLCLSQAILSYADSLNSELLNFDSKRLNQYSSANVIATAAALFMMLCNIRSRSGAVRKAIKGFARMTLPIILISWILEENLLRFLLGNKELSDIELMKYFLPFLIVTVAVAYLFSAVLMCPFNLVKALGGMRKHTAEESDEELYDEQLDDEENHYVGRYERGAHEIPEESESVAQQSFPEYKIRKNPDEFSVDELLELITNK